MRYYKMGTTKTDTTNLRLRRKIKNVSRLVDFDIYKALHKENIQQKRAASPLYRLGKTYYQIEGIKFTKFLTLDGSARLCKKYAKLTNNWDTNRSSTSNYRLIRLTRYLANNFDFKKSSDLDIFLKKYVENGIWKKAPTKTVEDYRDLYLNDMGLSCMSGSSTHSLFKRDVAHYFNVYPSEFYYWADTTACFGMIKNDKVRGRGVVFVSNNKKFRSRNRRGLYAACPFSRSQTVLQIEEFEKMLERKGFKDQSSIIKFRSARIPWYKFILKNGRTIKAVPIPYFDGAGGYISIKQDPVDEDFAIVMRNNYSRTGWYSFEGWATEFNKPLAPVWYPNMKDDHASVNDIEKVIRPTIEQPKKVWDV